MPDGTQGGSGAAGEAAGTGAGAGAGGGTAPWYQGVPGVDEAMVGHWRNQGWDNKPPQEVAVAVTKAWKEAEKFVGAPANELLRVPKDPNDQAAWNSLWQRLGKPTEAKGYDLADVKRADGSLPDEDFANLIRETAFKANLPKDAAAAVAREVIKFQEGKAARDLADKTAKLAEQKQALKTNWGANEAANLFVAQRAAAALGVPPETVSALEGVIGYDKVMEMFRQIGSKIGEDKFISGSGGGTGNATGVMTREQAVARMDDLKKDSAWTKAYLSGGTEQRREMDALTRIIVGAPRAA